MVREKVPVTRKMRETKTVSVDGLRSAMTKLDLTAAGLSVAIGYQSGAASAWLRQARMPAVAALACEALVRRNGSTLRETVLVITTNEADKVAAIETVAKSLGVRVQRLA